MALLSAFGFPLALVLMYVAWVAMQRTRHALVSQRSLAQETAHRLHVEETLRQAQKVEALGRLAGGVAHDFNNLLMIVGNNVYLLRKLQPALADSAQLMAMERAVAAGTKLTRQLLSFSRRRPLQRERLRLQDHMTSIRDLVAPAVGAAITIETHVMGDTAPVEIDIAELELAVLNLAINARDAMPGGGRLWITAANAPAAGSPGSGAGFVAISVRDDGPGIAPEMLPRVFEPFFTTKNVGQGTGLGLSQVHAFCTRAGGTATIDSRRGAGTTVRMLLPAASAATALEPALPAVSAEADVLHDLRVLLVEDNADVSLATVRVLEVMGCQVHALESADQATELLSTQATRFDIVLSDIVMGGMLDGIGLAERVRTHHPDLPMLLLSGHAMPSSLERASALGVDVLPKPCSAATLSTAIRRALAQARGRAAA